MIGTVFFQIICFLLLSFRLKSIIGTFIYKLTLTIKTNVYISCVSKRKKNYKLKQGN